MPNNKYDCLRGYIFRNIKRDCIKFVKIMKNYVYLESFVIFNFLY